MADIFKTLQDAGLIPHKPAETREDAPIKVLIYGEPGSGKTALAGTFPNCLLLDVDGGAQTTLDSDYARSLGLHEKTHYIRVNSVADVKKALSILRKDRGKTFKSLSIDTITMLSMHTVSDLTAPTIEEESDSASEDSDSRYMEQRDWGRLLLALYRIMKEAVDLGLHLCVTAHVAEREDTDGKEKKMPLLQGQFKDMSLAFFDAIGYMYTVYSKDPEKLDSKGKPQQKVIHRIQFVATAKVKAKDRTGRLGKQMDEITFADLHKALTDRNSPRQDKEAVLYDDEENIASPSPSVNGAQELTREERRERRRLKESTKTRA